MLQAANDLIVNGPLTRTIVVKYLCDKHRQSYGWWMEPNTRGVGAHFHDHEKEIFYVLEGTVSFLVGDTWREVEKGSFLFIPAGIQHDFENRSDKSAGVLNVFAPGAFEANMTKIVEWFADRPPQDAI